jgi:hypothetical protein
MLFKKMKDYAESIFSTFESKFVSKKPIEKEDIDNLHNFYNRTTNKIALQRFLHGKADLKTTNFELKAELKNLIEFETLKLFPKSMDLNLEVEESVHQYYAGDI